MKAAPKCKCGATFRIDGRPHTCGTREERRLDRISESLVDRTDPRNAR